MNHDKNYQKLFVLVVGSQEPFKVNVDRWAKV